jgi:hypothetical protein
MKGLLKEALDKEEELMKKIEGYHEMMSTLNPNTRITPPEIVKSLSKLQEQKKLLGNNYSYDISR